MKLFLQNNRGFSLVELLTVVAIIGLLAIIGIPQYNLYRVKAYQTEARGLLAALHAAESSFNVEYGGYHSSLKVLGVAPLGKARFNIGFGGIGTLVPNSPMEFSNLNTRQICSGTFGVGTDTRCNMLVPVPAIPAAATVNQTSYSAVAVAYDSSLLAENETLNPTSMIAQLIVGENSNANSGMGGGGAVATGAKLDGWGIDQMKVLTHASMDETATSCLVDHTCETLAIMPPDSGI